MKRLLGVLAAAVLLAGLALRPAVAGEASSFTYVANEFYTGLAYPLNDQTAAGTIHPLRPLGDIRFTVTGERFTLRIDDANVVGSVPVWMFGDGFEFRGCVPVGTAVDFSGFTPGTGVEVWLLGSSYGVYMGCTTGATTGTATVGQ
jgi:hypothetical protein